MTPDVLGRFAAATEVIREPEQLRTYECDGLTGRRVVPALVALPDTAEEVQAVVRICNDEGLPFVARGAGTGLSGGALPVAEGIVISLARMTRILEIDIERGQVVVEPGVTNLDVTRAVAARRLLLRAGPVVAAGLHDRRQRRRELRRRALPEVRLHVNHVLAAEIVLPDGELVELSVWDEGPDLLGVFVGSEGTLGIATKLTLRILRAPEAVRTLLAGFAHTDDAGGAVSAVIAAGILPAAIEMMDAITIEAAEAAVNANYPDGCGAVLIVELDGPVAQVEEDLARVEAICAVHDAREIRIASDPADRAAVWRGRKAAFAAMGRISPDYYVQDGVVPRTMLPAVLRRIDELSQEHGLRVGNVFHAGDGNLHPLVLYDGRVDGEAARAEELVAADPRGLHRRRRLDHRRARRRHRQGLRDAADVRRGRPRGDAAACVARSIRTGSRIRASSSRRRGCAARCRGRTASIRSRRPGLPTGSEHRRVRAGRPHVHRRGRHPSVRACSVLLAEHGQRLSLDPPGRSDARRVPARGSLGPAAPPLRDDARPRDRRHRACCPTARARTRAARS